MPFELGRPFGPPRDPAFQTRAIFAALQLLERETGPAIIEDFPDDDPRAQPDPAWHPPFIPAAVAAGSADSFAARLEAEIPLLQDAHQRWVAQHGRSTLALSGLPISECVRYAADWLRGKPPPRSKTSRRAGAAIHALREACLSSEDERLKLIAGNFMVPAARVRSSG